MKDTHIGKRKNIWHKEEFASEPQAKWARADIYEPAWRETHDPDFLRLLHYVYKGRERCNLYSFFYGDETLPEPQLAEHQAYR